MTDQPVAIFLVDDEPSVTDALAWMLDSVGIRAQAFNAPEQFLETFATVAGPCCIVLDLRMPGTSGLEVMEDVLARRSDVPITFLSAHGDIPTAVRTVKRGAFDFLQKPFEPQLFIDTVNRMMRMAANRFKMREAERLRQDRLSCLSPREAEVFSQLLDGKSSKEIGRHYDISPKTVDVHRTNIMHKLGVTSHRELIQQLRAPASGEAAESHSHIELNEGH